MTTLNAIGFWRSNTNFVSLPHPKEVITQWDPDHKIKVLRYLVSGKILREYMGFSYCRFRNGLPPQQMGSRDLTDGHWVWPDGLLVYLDRYNIDLPNQFLKYIEDHAYTVGDPDITHLLEDAALYGYSFKSWILWSSQVRRNRLFALYTRLFLMPHR